MNNQYRFSRNSNDKYLNIPIQIEFDNVGREDGIIEYEKEVLKEIINGIDDFETTRFANATYPKPKITEINYEFYFFEQADNILTATTTSWINSYNQAGFSNNEIYYFSNAYKSSFFKLDFYDTKTTENQRLYFTIILPTQQGLTTPGNIGSTILQIKKPHFKLDYVGADKEGFFIYWLKERDYININEFYMSAKFFNGKTGQFTKLMNVPQSTFNGTDKFNFNKNQYFYYKVILDYNEYEYSIYSEIPQVGQPPTLVRVGSPQTPIKWYEYVNP